VSRLGHHDATTNFSGVALGTTVHRLLGAVTLYGSDASPWRLIGRGSVVGAAAGALALAAIVTLRWVQTPLPTSQTRSVAQQPVANEAPTSLDDAAIRNLLSQASLDLEAGRAAEAIERLDLAGRIHARARTLPQAIVVRVKALIQLGRMSEAEAEARALIEPVTTPEGMELRTLLDARRTSPSTQ
jgi:hypothetical protein